MTDDDRWIVELRGMIPWRRSRPIGSRSVPPDFFERIYLVWDASDLDRPVPLEESPFDPVWNRVEDKPVLPPDVVAAGETDMGARSDKYLRLLDGQP